MSRRAAFIYHDILSRHVLREDHVMVPTRLRYTYELLTAFGAFDLENALLTAPRQASADELRSFHSEDYIDAVAALSRGDGLADAAKALRQTRSAGDGGR